MSNEANSSDSAAPALERRLATILSADVAGYTRLMGANEEATVQALRGHRAVFDALLKQHHGRVFNTAGDAILGEFPSAVEAVRCATEIQAALQTRNEHLSPDQKMLFRMGINLGDVVIQEGDLLGDGVNVAARIQTVAEPGGICISGSVYDQIQNKLSLQFKALGDRSFKNVGQPIRTFSITHGESGALPVASRLPGTKTAAISAAAAIVVAALAAGGYWLYRENETRRLEQGALAAQLAAEKLTTEEARRNAEEQSRRAVAAEGKAERERLLVEAAKREAVLQAQVQASEDARRHAETERKRIDAERQRAEDEKRVADARATAERRSEEAPAQEPRKKRVAPMVASLEAAKVPASASNRPMGADAKSFDGAYAGQLCNTPADPTKKVCWRFPLKVQSGVATGTWEYRNIGKPASMHVAIAPDGSATATVDGWNMKADAPMTGALNGRAADNRIDVEGRWTNGLHVEGHWKLKQ